MTEKPERVRPANPGQLKMADEIGEDVFLYNVCCLCGKKRDLLSFKRRKICVNCLNYVKTKCN